MRRVTFSSEGFGCTSDMASDKNNGGTYTVSGAAEEPVDLSMISLHENRDSDHQKLEEWLGKCAKVFSYSSYETSVQPILGPLAPCFELDITAQVF